MLAWANIVALCREIEPANGLKLEDCAAAGVGHRPMCPIVRIVAVHNGNSFLAHRAQERLATAEPLLVRQAAVRLVVYGFGG